MMKIEENKQCFQCEEEVSQAVTFQDDETMHESTICEKCLNNYVDGKIGFD
jgi:formylmethanofuran dehydrogenase subunit E